MGEHQQGPHRTSRGSAVHFREPGPAHHRRGRPTPGTAECHSCRRTLIRRRRTRSVARDRTTGCCRCRRSQTEVMRATSDVAAARAITPPSAAPARVPRLDRERRTAQPLIGYLFHRRHGRRLARLGLGVRPVAPTSAAHAVAGPPHELVTVRLCRVGGDRFAAVLRQSPAVPFRGGSGGRSGRAAARHIRVRSNCQRGPVE